MYKNLAEATKHICETIKMIENIEVQPDEKIIHDILLEKILSKITFEFKQEDLDILESHMTDDQFLESRMTQNIPSYESLLKETSEEILSQYIKEDLN
jgi:hypothetical protein